MARKHPSDKRDIVLYETYMAVILYHNSTIIHMQSFLINKNLFPNENSLSKNKAIATYTLTPQPSRYLIDVTDVRAFQVNTEYFGITPHVQYTI